MAINFPNSPSNGDIFGNFTYDTSIPGWRKTPENSASLPAGTIVQWGAATAPANWLICDGAAVSRTTYASLFAVIGVQYGSGDGTTTFNLPNLKGRVAVGLDSTQTEFNFLGETGGAKTHTLTAAEIPAHSHPNTLTNATVASSSHRHDFQISLLDSSYDASGPNAAMGVPGQGNAAGAWKYSNSTWSAGTLNASVSTTFNSVTGAVSGTGGRYTSVGDTTTPSATTTIGITNADNSGGGGAHNNLQPYIVLNYIIKTSAGITSGDSELAARVGVVEAQNNATPSSYNYLINGAFDVWQRGSSVSHAGGGVGADMWREYTDSGSGTQSKDTSVYPAGLPPQSYKFTAAANSTNWVIWQIIESANCAPLIGQTVTFSVYLKSSVARTFRLSLGTSTTTDAAWTGSWTTHSYQDFSVTTDWARYSFTTTVPSAARTLQFSVASNGANMANASTINVAGAQVELGQYATPFRRNSSNIKSELDACQRYYYRFTGSWANYIGMGLASTATALTVLFPFKVPMRATPTSFESYLLALENPGVNTVNVTGSYGDYTTSNTTGTIMITSSGMTVGKAYILRCSDNGAYVGWSAEL